MKFKVGDRVKTTRTVSILQQSFPVDSEGKVTEVHAAIGSPWPYIVKLDKYMADVRVGENEIEFLLPQGQIQLPSGQGYYQIDEIQDAYFSKYKEEVSKPRYCLHEWKSYTGLKEVFEYCIICDDRKKE